LYKNTVIGLYQETYFAMPRDGWKFERWQNYCKDVTVNECSFDVPADTVKESWGSEVPPLIAVFVNKSSQVYVSFSGQVSDGFGSTLPLPSPSSFSGSFSYDSATFERVEVHDGSSVHYYAPVASGKLQLAGFSHTFVGIIFTLENNEGDMTSDFFAIRFGLNQPDVFPSSILGPEIGCHKLVYFNLYFRNADGTMLKDNSFNGQLPVLPNIEEASAGIVLYHTAYIRQFSYQPTNTFCNSIVRYFDGPIASFSVAP
jgi:hypothetical protein